MHFTARSTFELAPSNPVGKMPVSVHDCIVGIKGRKLQPLHSEYKICSMLIPNSYAFCCSVRISKETSFLFLSLILYYHFCVRQRKLGEVGVGVRA